MGNLTIRYRCGGDLLPALAVASVGEARERFSAWRDEVAIETGRGASLIGGAYLYRGAKKVARMSYNGRLWETSQDGRELADDLTPMEVR
jgi:hypothetical protein